MKVVDIESCKKVIANYFGYSTFKEFKVRERNKNCKGTICEAILNITDELEKRKTADEMFFELGYEEQNERSEMIEYVKDDDNVFYIDKIDKTFDKSALYDTMGDDITMQELQAIYKKCQEMGWIE